MMSMLEIRRLDGQTTTVDASRVEALASQMRGTLLRRDERGYDDARTVWNAMIDRRPGLIARCSGAADAKQAIDFARDHDLLVSIHGGGHNVAGNAVCDGGLMIDLSAMNGVRVDPEARLAHAGPGATLGDVDHETQAFGLATPVGINSTTGIAGLTLGGGFGWITRKHGLTVDNLTAADVVTADGESLRASEKENADLFWALRGGGGNFGVVTRFEYRLHPVGPSVLGGLIVLPLADGPVALRKYRDFAAGLPEETSVWVVLRKAPPLPFLPEDVHGKEVVVFALCHIGDPDEGEKAIAPLRGFGKVLGEHVGVQPFAAWQQAFDPLLTPGARNYWKSHNFTELKDEVLDAGLDFVSRLPSDQCEIFFGQLGGAANRVAPDATAYAHRNANYVMNVHARWNTADEDAAVIGWSREFFDATKQYATGGVYVNFMTEDETDRVASGAYGPNYARLAKIKKTYDPLNRFRMNHNIPPGS
jgi:FAD/FMN-containing dehydrogenase